MSRTTRAELGASGEELAARYLEARGHRVRARNVRTRFGEIDLVTETGEALVFVEVRTRRGRRHGTALESIGREKRRRLTRLAEHFLTRWRGGDRVIRFDVVGIDWTGDLPVVEHVEGAFEAED